MKALYLIFLTRMSPGSTLERRKQLETFRCLVEPSEPCLLPMRRQHARLEVAPMRERADSRGLDPHHSAARRP